MRATSPSGSAAFEGVVGWSGELGYGVRAPEAAQDIKDSITTPLDMIDEHGHGHEDHAPGTPEHHSPSHDAHASHDDDEWGGDR
jgi:NADH-quinone oxidoreductase subunit I